MPRRHEGTKKHLYRTDFVSSCLRAVLLVVVCASCAPSAGTTPVADSALPASIVDPYLKIWDALADDKIDNIKSNAGELTTAATALGAPAMKIQTAAVQLSATAGAAEPDIEAVRDTFGVLSEAIETYATGLKLKMPEDVRVAYCPMVRKPWLQKGETLANPYYGKSMATCGTFR